MNTNALTSAAKALDLTPEQMAQQADLACRLMSMALIDAALRREVVAKAARLATTATPTNQLEGATHGE